MEVLIIDDHPMIQEMLRAVVEKAVPGAAVAAESSLAAGIARARQLEDLQLVLLDLGLPDQSGIESLRTFRRAVPEARVAVVSALDDPACMRETIDAGAAGFIPKGTPTPLIGSAVRLIAEGGVYVPPAAIAAGPVSAATPKLTPRQVSVLALIAKGLHNRQIAAQLRLSEETVKQHVHTVFRKLGVSSRTGAVAAAARLGIALD